MALVLITVSGFTLVDLLYLALVMNYALQCQLIFFAVCAAVNKFRTIHYQVDAAIKVAQCNLLLNYTFCYRKLDSCKIF